MKKIISFLTICYFGAFSIQTYAQSYSIADTATANQLILDVDQLVNERNFQAASEKLALAKAIFLEVLGPNHALYSDVLNGEALIQYFTGDFESALLNAKESLKIRLKELGADHPDTGVTYHNLALINQATGNYNAVVDYNLKALAIYSKYPQKYEDRIAKSYNNLGVAFIQMAEFEEAKRYYELAFELQQNSKQAIDSLVILGYYGNLGAIYTEIGPYDKAIEYSSRFVEMITRQFGANHPYNSIGYFNMGKAYRQLGAGNESLKFSEQALEIQISFLGPDSPVLSNYYNGVGESLLYLERYEEAVQFFQKSLACLKFESEKLESGSYFYQYLLQSLLSLAKTNRLLHEKSGTLSYLLEANYWLAQNLSVLDYQLLATGETTEWQTLGGENSIYEEGILIHQLLYAETERDTFLKASFKFAERSKAFLLYKAIQEANALHFAGIPDQTLTEEQNLRLAISELEKARQGQINAGRAPTDSLVLALSDQLFEIRIQQNLLKKDLEKDYPKYYKLKYDLSVLSVDEIQEKLLNEEETLVEYMLGDSAIYIFCIRKDTFHLSTVNKDFPLEDWINQMRKGLYARYSSEEPNDSLYLNSTYSAEKYTEAAYNLYQKLVAPISNSLKGSVSIIPDGILGYIPFQALIKAPVEKAYRYHSHDYFGLDFPIGYCYSATLLKEMINKKHLNIPSATLLGVAPYYEGSIEKLDSIYNKQVNKYDVSNSTASRNQFESLENSGEEVYSVSKIWDGDYLIEKDATEAAFVQKAPQYQQLHLATHGVANDAIGAFAFLAFTEIPDTIENELLFIKDVYNLELNADLVVLSACQTGIGKLQRGEGIISLARAFAYAGAKSIVTTLWNVNDVKTKDLMIDFHLNLKNGADKDVALFQAQKKYLETHKGELANPYYWAPFISIGNKQGIK